jgi:SAM-dependent methyltransferase
MKHLAKHLLPAPLYRALGATKRQADRLWQRRFGVHFCPVCETRFNAFLPLPTFYAEEWKRHGYNATDHEAETLNEAEYSCPHCGAADRDRLYALHLRDRLAGVPDDFKLVDFAPSKPLRTWINRTCCINYRTADLFMPDVDDRVDLTDMSSYPDGSVDAFVCSHVLEHIPEDRRALRELFRILRSGGWGILMVPIGLNQPEVSEDPAKATSESDRWRHFGQGDHVRSYNKQGFIDRVHSAGFKLQQLGVAHFGAKTFRRCGITPQSVLYVAEKL